MQSNLTEGLSRKALEHLILPVVSIDEYESKISDKRCVVVGFFVNDEAPANDLSHFIDRSSLPILDTEVSPAPTSDGFYITWVELRRSEDLPNILISLLNEIENLCNIKEWQFTCPQHTEPLELNKNELKNHLILDSDKIAEVPDDQPPLKEDIEFWQHAPVHAIQLTDRILSLHLNGSTQKFSVNESNEQMPILPDNSNARLLQTVLGPSYAVYAMHTGFLVECGSAQRYIEPLY